LRVRALGTLVLGLILAGACAPTIAPPGSNSTTPMLLDDHIRAADGAKLPLRVWRSEGPPKAVVLGLHGFNDYSKSFDHPAKTWTARGITVYAYDQRGFGAAPHHGLWPGTRAMTGDLAATSRLLRERYPGVPLVLVGESMGAAVILAAYGGGDRPAADGVVLSAPAVWSRDYMPFYQRAALWLGAHTLPWMKLTGQGLKIRASDNDDMLRALGRDPLVIKATRIDSLYGLSDLMDAALAAAPQMDARALVLYGREEQLIPKLARQALLDTLPNNGRWRYAEYQSGFHMLLRDLNADLVLRDIASWAVAPGYAPRRPKTEYAERLGYFP
jgi:acylglycerol lipase